MVSLRHDSHPTTRQPPPSARCQATAKTEPEATRKLSHLDPARSSEAKAGLGGLAEAMSAKPAPSTAGVGFGVAQTISPRAPRGLIGLEGVMQTPEEVLVMRQLLERGVLCSVRHVYTAAACLSTTTCDSCATGSKRGRCRVTVERATAV
jgi:hypothetical protein